MEEYLQLLDETGEARRDSGASDRMQQNTPAAASAGVEEQYSIDPDFDREIVAGMTAESSDWAAQARRCKASACKNGIL